jgi:hypothetical protein
MEGKEFYYQVMNDSDGKAVFLITPKAFYDTEGCLFDSMGAVNEILPRGFQEYKPSYFSFPGDPIFYILFNQKPPYYPTIYEATPIYAQKKLIKFI